MERVKGDKKVALSVSLNFKRLFGQYPRVSAGTSLLFLNIFLRSFLNFRSVGTALMRKFALYFTERQTIVSSDVCMTLRSICQSYSSNWSPDFCSLQQNRQRFRRLCVLNYATQLSCIFQQKNHCILVTTLLRLFIWLFLNLPVRKRALIAEFTTRFWLIKLTFGTMPIVTMKLSANTFEEVSARL